MYSSHRQTVGNHCVGLLLSENYCANDNNVIYQDVFFMEVDMRMDTVENVGIYGLESPVYTIPCFMFFTEHVEPHCLLFIYLDIIAPWY